MCVCVCVCVHACVNTHVCVLVLVHIQAAGLKPQTKEAEKEVEEAPTKWRSSKSGILRSKEDLEIRSQSTGIINCT